MLSILACPVRDCGEPLTRDGHRCTCPRRHSHDVARSGYVNLLQPQDRRSRAPGDAADVVRARAMAIAAGVGRLQILGLAERAGAALAGRSGVVADLGSGAGDLLIALTAAQPQAVAIGIDISASAADFAARRAGNVIWVVANADRRLPLLDGAVDVVLSLHGRRNPAECARVLGPGGRLMVAVPAPDDLIELRTRVQGQRVERERASEVVAEHAPFFALDERTSVRESLDLDADVLRAILQSTYRGGRTSEAGRVGALTRLSVTSASELLVFRRTT